MNSNKYLAAVMISLSCLIITSVSAFSADASNSVSITHALAAGRDQGISNPSKDTAKSGNTTFSDLFRKGTALDLNGNYAGAIQYYDKALTVMPNNSRVLIFKGNALTNLGNYGSAVKIYDQALSSRPNNTNDWSVFNNRGNDLFRMGKLDDAVKSYDRALALKPDLKNAIVNKADALFELGNYSGAISYWDKALSMTAENNIILLNNKAHALFELGNYTGAITYYNKVLTMAPGSTSAGEGKLSATLALNTKK
jgi:tetratricopeptide (TPR) repeat protein